MSADAHELIAERFRLLRRLGAGGMGDVALAADTWRDGRRIALKLAKEGPGARALEQEYLLLRGLRHPHVVAAGEVGSCERTRQTWMSMEHADGVTLRDAARSMDVPALAAALAGVARALDFVHSRRLVHGDVKEDNVVVGADGARVVLLDFGLARTAGDPPPARGFSGTLTHAAPEVMAGAAADAASDLYALGVAAFTVLAGRPPFPESDPAALAAAHLRREAPSLLEAAPRVPRGLAALVGRMLAKDAAARPSASEAVAALEREGAADAADAAASLLAWAAVPRLVGREQAEMAAQRLLARARDPREPGPRTAWFVGGPRQGKTRLLDGLAARAQASRVVVLRGEPGAEPLSLLAGPLQDAVRMLGGGDAVSAHRGVLARVSPSLGGAEESPEPLPPDEEALRVADAAWSVLRAMARPVLVLLDDVDRADAASARVVALLARHHDLEWERGRRVPLAMACALREPAPWAGAWPSGHREDLPELGANEVEEAVAAMLPGFDGAAELASRVVEAGGGCAALAEDWVAELVRRGVLTRGAKGFAADLASAAAAAPPPGEAERVRREIGSLPAHARALLEAAAEAPQPIDPAWMARAAGLAADAAREAEDALEQRGLLRFVARPEGRRASAASATVRDAARALADRPALALRLLRDPACAAGLTPADRAELAATAGRRDEAAALLREAIDAAARARDPARTALLARRLSAQVEGRERRDALRRAALALGESGDALAARDVLDEAAAGLTAGEHAEQLAAQATVAHRLGALDEARELFRRAHAAGRLPWAARMDEARVLAGLRDPATSDALVSLEREPPGPAERAALCLLQGSVLLRQRRDDEAESVLDEAAHAARELGLRLTEAACWNNLGLIALRRGASSAARRRLGKAARLRREAGARVALAGTLSNLALSELARGRPRAAARHARAAAEIQQDAGQRRGELISLLNVAAATLAAEDVTAASEAIAGAQELAPSAPDDWLRGSLEVVAAERSLLAGDVAGAASAALRAQDHAERCADESLRAQARLLHARATQDLDGCRSLARAVLARRGTPLDVDAPTLAACACLLARAPSCWLSPWTDGPPVGAEDAKLARDAAEAALAALSEREGPPADCVVARLGLAAALRAEEADDAEAGAALALLPRGSAREALPPSLRRHVHCALAWQAWRADALDRASRHLDEAMDVVRRQARKLDGAARETFLAAGEHAELRQAVVEMRRRRLEQASRAGWFDVAAPPRRRAARAEGPLRREAARAQRRARKLSEILEISRGISELVPVDEILARTLDAAMRFMDADRGFIVLGQEGEPLRFAASRDREGREVPRAGFAVSHSVLQEVVRTRQAVLSSDARADARFVSKASVLALDLRSVLVAPMVARNAVAGALYVDNLQSSGAFDEEDRELLAMLAAQAAVAVENARLHAASIEGERIEQELNVARAIQQSLLPRSLPVGRGFRLAAAMLPARELGGDFYDVIVAPDGTFTLAVGDVSGKGVGAALFMVMARTILRAEARAGQPLDEWLVQCNAEIAAQMDEDKFLTLAALRAGGEGHRVRWALAGHEPPIVYRRAESKAEALPAAGLALGMLPSLRGRVAEEELELAEGDLVACVSDGVTECRSGSGELFGRARLHACVLAHAGRGADALLSAILRDIDAWRGAADRADDVTVVVLEAVRA